MISPAGIVFDAIFVADILPRVNFPDPENEKLMFGMFVNTHSKILLGQVLCSSVIYT